MNGKVIAVSLVVGDQQAALDFYTNQVGFEKRTDVTGPGGYRYVTVGLKGQDLEIALYQQGSVSQVNSKNWKPASNPPISIGVENCMATFEQLASRGVKFLQEKPEVHPWGTSATFSDLDGNLISVNQFSAPTNRK